MNKKFVLVLSALLVLSSTTAFAANNKSSAATDKKSASGFGSSLDQETMYYQNASLHNAISKYKKADYSGCLQELFSYLQQKPNDAVAYYYMAMAYTQIGDSSAAVEAYEKVIALAKDSRLSNFAVKGKDCLTNGPTCAAEKAEETAANVKTGDPKAGENKVDESAQLDEFINAPYGTGLSPEVEKQLQEGKLKRIQESINKKDRLENSDVERIKNFDIENSSQIETIEKIAKAEPSDKELLNAIKTLREAGVSVSIQPTSQPAAETSANITATPDTQPQINPMAMMNGYTDPQMAQMSMMLGNNNNNNNNMMNMLPFLMQQHQNGQNIDPQVMQAIMMQQMMPSMDFGLNNNNN